MKPSNFSKIRPWGSVVGKAEAEIVAQNILVILKRTGDTFRKLDYEEYKKEREKDGNYSSDEESHFYNVIGYLKSPETVALFCPDWGEIYAWMFNLSEFKNEPSKINELPEDIQNMLKEIHTHAELCDPNEIVYREKDIIELLKKIKN